MPKFRKRPVVVEAEQWFPGLEIEGVLDLRHAFDIKRGSKKMEPGAYIETLEGPMMVSPGDWIITGVHGEKYPCKPDIFEKTYEAVVN